MTKLFKCGIFLTIIMSLLISAYSEELKIKVNFKIEELVFSVNVLNNIEIKGEEVNPFMDIKNVLLGAYNEANKEKQKDIDVVFVISGAKNFLYFMQKARMRGDAAAMFYDINKKVTETVKKKE